MSRSSQVVTQFPALDHEPRGNGPPPSYRNVAATEDSWSTVSGSDQGVGKRRSSWNNLVEVGGDPRVSMQPAPHHTVHHQPPTTTTFSATPSRTSSDFAIPATVYHSQVTATGQALPMQKVYSNEPRLVSIPKPAGTFHTGSVPASRSGSVMTGLNPSPPIIHKSMRSIDSKQSKPKKNRLQDCKNFLTNPRVIGCSLCLLLALIIAVIIIVVLTQVLPSPKNATFTWIAPAAFTNGQNVSSTIDMKTENTNRIRFQMTGAIPMKGNFINYYDFDRNQVVVIDSALQSNGKNLYCFIVPLDRSAMPSSGQVRKAAKNSVQRHQQTEGWAESWTWMPSPIQTQQGSNNSFFNPVIPECNGARLVNLQQTSNQQNRKCIDCYDFCLPSYGIMRDSSKSNEEYLNINRRDCFYLFVPEWRTFAQANSIEQNQQDFESYYRNRQHLQTSNYNGNDSRWIPLSGMGRQLMNATGNFAGQVGNTIGGYAQNLGNTVGGYAQNVMNTVTGQNQNGNQNGYPNQQQQNGQYQGPMMPNQYGQNQQNQMGISPNGQPQQPQLQLPQNGNQQQQQQQTQQGFHPAVNGIVNLNGVNGNNGNNEYNQQQQPAQTQNGYQPDVRRNAQTFRSNVNSGYTVQPQHVSNGNSQQQQQSMNGFGAQPSYQNSQFGFNPNPNANGNDPRNQQQKQNQNGYNSNHQGAKIGTVLNAFGNPVNIHGEGNTQQQQQNNQQPQQMHPQQPQIQNTGFSNFQTSMGLAETPFQIPQSLLQQTSQYTPDVQQINYNIPNWNQPNRPDALSRQGRIFK
ncbi:unnamed protein product [Caenorhabditis angaria]|uniref:Uncharacterized protein n=1 Tax=Caenorhabditis angaria TaxID=860376 RepID=A0A9P1IDP8_9PELO|nr:unnamed protein product [Caenorhabditis angaria]